MPNYENGLIYKLCCKDANITDIYIGSTTSFRHRKAGHKSDCNNENSKKYNFNLYKCIRENGGFLNWEMILVEYYSCKTKLELEKKEREIIEELKPTLNKTIPSRTKKEWYYDNKEKVKEWREENKEQLLEYQKKYTDNNKEKIKENAKEYYEENKEKIAEYDKKYYENNKENYKKKHAEYYEENKEKYKEKVTCECGAVVVKYALARHKRTIRHKGYIALKNNIDNI